MQAEEGNGYNGFKEKFLKLFTILIIILATFLAQYALLGPVARHSFWQIRIGQYHPSQVLIVLVHRQVGTNGVFIHNEIKIITTPNDLEP